MARINFEDSVFTTPQWNKLIVSIAKKYAHCDLDEFQELAKGRLHTIWRLAQDYWIDNRTLIPEKVWALIPYHQDMIDCGFAEKRESGIYIYGSEEQFEWLISRRESGRKGGLKRQANLRKRDDIEGEKESNFAVDDVPWPDEQDEKISTFQDDAIYQDQELSTFDETDNEYQSRNHSKTAANDSNAKANSSNAKANSSKSKPLTLTLTPTPLVRSPFLKGRKKINKKKKNQKRRLNENCLDDMEHSKSTQSNTKEASATSASHFDNACYKFKEKFGTYGVTIGAKAQSRYFQLLGSGITSEQVLTMIDNYANYIIPQITPTYSPFKRSFETFIGTKGKWHCVEHLEPIQQMSQSEKTLKEIRDLEAKYKTTESQPKVEDWRAEEIQFAKTKKTNGSLTAAGDLLPKLFR